MEPCSKRLPMMRAFGREYMDLDERMGAGAASSDARILPSNPPRNMAPNQMLAFSPTSTSPSRTAVGAMKGTHGDARPLPSNSTNTTMLYLNPSFHRAL